MQPHAPTLVHLLERRAAAAPERPLYTFLADGESDSGTLTYAELHESARALAGVLLTAAAPGDRAVLLYPVGLEYLVGFFGCLYAGIVAVPAYPLRTESRSANRIRSMLADCRPSLVLTCARLVPAVESAIGGLGASIQVLGTDDTRAGAGAALPIVRPEMVAFLQYTSASIADAKGVRVTHANLMANQEMIRHAMAHGEQSHFVSWLPPYHDMGLVGNLLQPLYLGASCVFMPPAAFVQKPVRWLSAISKYRAKTSGAPNFAYSLCVKKVAAEEVLALDLSDWTVAYCGAESIDAGVVDRFCAHFAPAGFRRDAFYPCYGLAEATLMASGSDPCRPPQVVDADPDLLERGVLQECPAARGRRLVGCGAAPPGSTIAIVQPESRRPLPDGRVGEIWVQGAHVADGYWNRPAASQEAFEARLDGHAGTFLRTGDLGAIVAGELYVVGRIKETIIHQGRNLSPTDVESVVEASAGELVEACAAFALPGEHTEDLGIVVEVARRRFPVETAESVAESIAWDVYRAFEVMPARLAFAKKGCIPRTTSGKKQRLRCARLLALGTLDLLADWHRGAASPTPTGDAADGESAWLARLISRFTGLPVERTADAGCGVGAWGLDSLRAVEIAHEIERRTGVALPISLFYEAATLGTIAREIEARRGCVEAVDELARELPEQGEPAQMEVTAGQEAVWFSQHVSPESPAFHLKWALRFAAALDADRLREAVRAVISRHDALRCVFRLSDEGRVGAHRLPAGVVDFEHESRDGDGQVLDWIDRECDRSFRLEQDLLVRVRHGRGPGGDLVGFSLHHLIADLWSCALFTDEVLEQYETGASVGRPQSFRRYARHVSKTELEGEACLRYWRGRLGSAPALDPVDVLAGRRSRPATRRYEGSSVSSGLDGGASLALLESARRRRVSRHVLLLSAYGVWLWSLTRLEDFLTGCLASGRGRAAFARVQGLLTNPFAVRFRMNAATTLDEVVSSVRDQVLGALEREDYPFQAVARALRPARELGRAPLFQNMFVYQQLPASSPLAQCVLGRRSAPIVQRKLEIECVRLPVRSARYDFTLYCMEMDAELAWEAVYDTGVLEDAHVAELVRRFGSLVRRVPHVEAGARVGELVKEPEPAY